MSCRSSAGRRPPVAADARCQCDGGRNATAGTPPAGVRVGVRAPPLTLHSKDLRNATTQRISAFCVALVPRSTPKVCATPQIDSRAPPLATRFVDVLPRSLSGLVVCVRNASPARHARARRPRLAHRARLPLPRRRLRNAQLDRPNRRAGTWCWRQPPASPTPTWCRRSSGVVGLRLLVGAEAVARNPECARWRAGALACMALLVLQDRGGLGPRQSCDAERGP